MFKVQTYDAKLIGQPWRTVKEYPRQAVAERVAQNMKLDGELTRVIEAHRTNIGLYGARVVADLPRTVWPI
jgi:hypothetical protein